jgi:hypothetical protein
MRAHLRRLIGLPLALALALALSAGLAPAHAAAWGGDNFTRDLYFSAGYERQVDSRTCTAASTAMMVNFLARRDLGLSQLSILRYEQPRDALNDRVQRGSDPLGWAKAVTYYSRYSGRPTTYAWKAFTSEYAALKDAAARIARFGKPVGLVVQHGKHAVVMTGFTANHDPNRGDDFQLKAVFISDPYGYRHVLYAAADSPLNRYFELDATTTYDRLWYGKYITVVPQN